MPASRIILRYNRQDSPRIPILTGSSSLNSEWVARQLLVSLARLHSLAHLAS
jgi:hypothetical protein